MDPGSAVPLQPSSQDRRRVHAAPCCPSSIRWIRCNFVLWLCFFLTSCSCSLVAVVHGLQLQPQQQQSSLSNGEKDVFTAADSVDVPNLANESPFSEREYPDTHSLLPPFDPREISCLLATLCMCVGETEMMHVDH